MGRWIERLLGLVFVLAAAGKLARPDEFARAIEAYHLVGMGVARCLAVALPPAELVAGAGLVAGVWRAGARVWVAVLLLVFSAALLWAWARGIDVDCGCFGGEWSLPVGWALARNGVLGVAWAASCDCNICPFGKKRGSLFAG